MIRLKKGRLELFVYHDGGFLFTLFDGGGSPSSVIEIESREGRSVFYIALDAGGFELETYSKDGLHRFVFYAFSLWFDRYYEMKMTHSKLGLPQLSFFSRLFI
jgi:hypothetical protein